MGEGAALDGPMGRDGELQHFIRGVFLETDMAAALTDDHEACPLQSPDDLEVGETWDNAQRVISANCREPVRISSSSTGSR